MRAFFFVATTLLHKVHGRRPALHKFLINETHPYDSTLDKSPRLEHPRMQSHHTNHLGTTRLVFTIASKPVAREDEALPIATLLDLLHQTPTTLSLHSASGVVARRPILHQLHMLTTRLSVTK